MAQFTLKLGTRRSALARAQSGAVARRLESLHPGLSVEMVGIDTRGDRITDVPLSQVDGKAFFTAEIHGENDTRTGVLVEFDRTETIFSKPSDERTENYVTGRFG